MDEIIRAMTHASLELLEELSLSQLGPPTSFSLETDPAVSPVRGMLKAPNLRSLCLCNMTIPVGLSGLTSLVLRDYSYLEPVQDADTFLNMLRLCIHLENLDIDNWIPDLIVLHRPQRDERGLISFPSLAHLKLRHYMERINLLWSFLFIPKSAAIAIHFIDFDEDPANLLESGELALALRAFASHTLVNGRSTITRLSVLLDPDSSKLNFAFDTSRDPPGSTSPLWLPSQSFVLKFTFHAEITHADEYKGLFNCICSGLSLRLDQIETLEYDLADCDPGLSEANPNDKKLYVMFPSVTTLHMRCTDSDPAFILRALSPFGQPRFFPKLQALQLRWGFNPSRSQSLLDALKSRVAQRRPLASIGFDDGNHWSWTIVGSEGITTYLQEVEAIVPHTYTYTYRE
ncbi:unnamed protein product [Peniophora sp. CBMAI 1063]|nr:unnamed protein product [Peniophora sp. CBMAI 1063]